ncbi:hypothetical protein SAMN05660691_03424 [Rheinheimera pacifica]|uniref:Restriction endonuclease n=1 Tax=Rheinheimera pacifica TaxID=173990 RepID=A0A1H6N936_9GAMM|nr:ATP-binding protein [Rheinheimera pacifica]SEI08034.1 hypothetical protein SAMN05660691_03424 [Rheinheimera pacifica]
MNDYDFSQLNDKEFEVMCADLLGYEESVRYERFKPGKDAGVDGRFFSATGNETILQCKHWASSPLKNLISHLETVEFPKVAKLNPDRYVLMISHSLSRSDKTKISAALHPFILTDSDIFGREDLNDLLARHSEVEQRHYKLWISSTTVLKCIINKPIMDRSQFEIEEIVENARLYVPTINHQEALEKLESLGCAIITGHAGIGKTTLAKHLALHYISKGFQFFSLAEGIREAEAVFESNKLQVFLFDDFLGSNYLEALSGHEGTHIVQFIKRIVRDKTKRFLLTSRSTILNQGKLLSNAFQHYNIERNEFEITLGSLADIDKAQMLYNHMWHSDLPDEYVDKLYQDKRYRKIIAHKNFNPRLIKYITNVEWVSNNQPDDYWSYISEMMDNPVRVWEHPFEAQHDDFGRALVLLVTLNRRSIDQNSLADAYKRFVSFPENLTMNGRRDFLTTMKHLSGSLLSRVVMKNMNQKAIINLFNPSIGDYVLHRYAKDIPSLKSAFSSLRTANSLRTLEYLTEEKLLDAKAVNSMLMELLAEAINSNYSGCDSEYVAMLCKQRRKVDPSLHPSHPHISEATKYILSVDCPSVFEAAAELIEWVFSCDMLSSADVVDFFLRACEKHPSYSEIASLTLIISKLDSLEKAILMPKFGDAVADYLIDAAYDEFPDDNVFDQVYPGEYSDAEKNLRCLVTDKLSDFGFESDSDLIERIVDGYALYTRHDEYFGSHEPDLDTGRSSAEYRHFDEIDDLFERIR